MGYRGQPGFQVVCQFCHFAWACAVCQLAVTLHLPGRYGIVWMLLFSVVKEWLWDWLWPVGWPWAWCGEHDTAEGSVLDNIFYLVGILTCWVLFKVTGQL